MIRKSVIQATRESKGITARNLARSIGISSTTLSQIENARFVAGERAKAALLEFLGGSEKDYFNEYGLAIMQEYVAVTK